MALDILSAFGSRATGIVTHQPKHDLESIVYVLIWICVLYSGPNTNPLPVQDTCLDSWANCKSIPQVVRLWSTKTGELTTHVPVSEFTPYFEALGPFVRKLYRAIEADHRDPETMPFTHDILRNVLLDAFFAAEEPQTPEKRTAKNTSGVSPSKRNRQSAS